MRSRDPGERGPAWLVWPVVVGAAALYLATLSHNYLGDGIKFALQVEQWPVAHLVQPRHLGYPLVGWWFYRLWQALGWSGRAVAPLQVLSALGGAACVGLMYRLAAKLGQSPWAATLVAAGFAVSRGVWLYATDAETVTLSLALALAVLLGLVGQDAGAHSAARCAAVGLLWGLSVLAHAGNVLILPALGAAYLLAAGEPLRKRMARLGLCLLVATATMALGYGLAFWLLWGYGGLRSVTTLGAMLALGDWSSWGAQDLAHGAYGFLKALVGFPGLGPDASTATFLEHSNRISLARFAAYYGAATLLAVAPLAALVRQRRAWSAQRGQWTLAVLGAWAAAHAIAAVAWVPGDVQFWTPVLAAWWLSVALLLRPRDARMRPTQTGAAPRVAVILAGCLAGLVLLANAWSFALPNRRIRENRPYQMMASLAERTSSHDVIVTTGADRLELYLLYFAGREPLPVSDLLPYANWTEEDLARAIVDLADRAADDGGRVYLAGFAPGAEARWADMDRQGVVRAALEWIPATVAWEVAGERILLVSQTH